LEKIKQQVAETLALRDDLIEKIDNEEALLHLIELYVQELIDTNFEQLLRVLYRIDIPDYKVKAVIDAEGPQNATAAIARLILEREKQKVATREKYKSKDTDSNDWIFDI
jgi:hypothetical protein